MDNPRPLGACENADGSQKPSYKDRKTARDVARNARKKYNNPTLSAYRCSAGEHYHVGRNIRKAQRLPHGELGTTW